MAFGASERLRRLISMRRDLQSRPSTFPSGPRGRSVRKSSKIFRRPVGDGDIPTDLIPEGIVSDGRRVERGQSPPQILCGRFQGGRLSIWIWIVIREAPGEIEKRRLVQLQVAVDEGHRNAEVMSAHDSAVIHVDDEAVRVRHIGERDGGSAVHELEVLQL